MLLALVLSLSPWGHAAATASVLRGEAPTQSALGSEEAPAEEVLTEAGRAFAEGVQAYKDGRYEDAHERFARAQALAPHPDTLFNLGLAQQRTDRHVEAWRSFDALLEQAKDEQEREDILLAQAASRPHVAWVKVLSDAPGVVCLDGEPMPRADGGPGLLTTPGPHRLDVDHQRRTVALTGGEQRTVELWGRPVGPPPPPRGTLRAMAGLAIGGAGAAVGLGVGSVLVEDERTRLGLGIGVAGAGTLALTSTVVALVVHRRARRWKPPPPPRTCP